MMPRVSIPLFALAASVLAAAAAHAGPVGNQYLPQVPKAGNKQQHNSSGSSSGTSSSSYVPATTTESSQPVQTQQKQRQHKPKHHTQSKNSKAIPASSNGAGSTDSAGGPWIPIAILVIVAGVSTAVGLTLRRRAA